MMNYELQNTNYEFRQPKAQVLSGCIPFCFKSGVYRFKTKSLKTKAAKRQSGEVAKGKSCKGEKLQRGKVAKGAIALLPFCLLALWFSVFPACAAQILLVDVTHNPDAVPLNIGDILHFKVQTDGNGEVTVDIGTVRQGIKLRDDGTNGDAVRRDNSYELNYRILAGDTIEDGPIIAHFIAADGSETIVGAGSEPAPPLLTIDATQPIIANDGVRPNPFNPNKQMSYVYYTLTEKCHVSINILSPDGSQVRTLANPSSDYGENQAAWDGTDEAGRILQDSQYTYLINAADASGNEAEMTGGGVILSTVEMKIGNSIVAPNSFSPNGDNVRDVTRINFEILLLANREQLLALGFGNENELTRTTLDDDIPAPFALVGLTVLDSTGKVVLTIDHDLAKDSDTDFEPNGWPSGQRPVDIPLGSGNYLGEVTELPDYGDEVTSNDWDTLIPLNENLGANTYTADFGVVWDAKDVPDGVYLINISCELVSRTWDFADFMRQGDVIIGEKWHAIPTSHYGVIALPIQKSVIIDRGAVIGTDNDAPIAASTTPNNGALIDPSKKQISEISAVLDDGAGGSGVDLSNSTITLINPVGNKQKGTQKPFDMNTIKLVLDEPLSASGEYTISIITVDKRGNKSQPMEYTFTIKDTSPPTVVLNTITPAPNKTHTEIISEISVVLTDGLTGSGVDLTKSALLVKDSANNTIAGKVSFDDKSTQITYTLEKPLETNGVYTIVVIAVDMANAQAIYNYEFTLNLEQNITLSVNGQDYAIIYADTNIQKPSELDPAHITVEVASSQPPILAELHQLGKAIRFQPSNVSFSKPIDIIMPYDPNSLPSNVQAESLKLYGYTSKTQNNGALTGASGWHHITNVNVQTEENRLNAKVTQLDEYYIVAYLRTAEDVLAREVKLSSRYFYPRRDEYLAITFPNTASEYRVDIYNTAAELIRTLPTIAPNFSAGGAKPNNSVSWDGRNEDDMIVNHGVYILRIRYTENGQVYLHHKLVAVVK